MIPVGDTLRPRRTPVMNWLLIAVNVLVFLYEFRLAGRALDRFFFTWGVIPQNVLVALSRPLAPASTHVFLTLLTAQFIHGGWLHLLGNMLFLWIFGDNVEDVLGSFGYLAFYLVCGVSAVLAQVYVLSPFLGRQAIPTFGASGAIAGVLGAYLVLYPLARVSVLFPILILFIPFDLPAFVIIGWWFVQQFFYGLTTLTPAAAQSGGVAFWAHIGGFLTGMILIVPFIGRARQRAPWDQDRI